eukprot:CAMPEP_0172323376 /NCGR_PEP_ID=MMETSP1058-20130122/48558_1 /TAXON_ID=83371 /ORGANISM="Detonula confervacea, Strain CCMP 353" /LENGTH=591 /DNA_ID=CAMNT_0013039353 /DNA_START=23 /DNA_END=1798 /DNA_ORIENTATION=-
MAEAEGETQPVSPATTSAPIPIPNTHPTDLHKLISAKQWPAAIDRCHTHPHEVGSSSHLRSERGYTALHTLMAYNQGASGEDLVPVVKAIFRAADEIDYGAEFRLGVGGGEEGSSEVDDESKINTNEIVEGEDTTTKEGEARRTGGSWRLLLDQRNRACWSPLHLICVQGGIAHGKVPVMKALLQMDEHGNNNNEHEFSQYQQRILTLLDRQNRNILHHLLDTVVPSSFQAVRFALAMTPSLLFQRDNRDKTPLDYVLERIMENPGTRRRHYMNSYGNDDAGMKKNYLMLKLLVGCMEQETRGWGEVKVNKKDSSVAGADSVTPKKLNQTISNDVGNREDLPKSVLQSACLLPRSVCPANGSLLTYLSSDNVSKMEANVRDDAKLPIVNMAAEADENGNHALHLFVSNKSYGNASNSKSSDEAPPGGSRDCAMDTNTPHGNTEHKIMQVLIDKDPNTVHIPNSNGELPLHIAMKSGRRRAVAMLVVEYPEAVLLDDNMDDLKLFMHILGCISVPQKVCPERNGVNGNHSNANDENQAKIQLRCLATMFGLVRARPDIVSLACSSPPKSGSKGGSGCGLLKKKWWKNINPFL